jgi:hypothetical protein
MQAAVQRPMPRRRSGYTTSVTIDREHLRITASASSDGTLGEVIIQWGKQGATTAGLIDAYATALTTGLQHHVPLADLLTPGASTCTAPPAAAPTTPTSPAPAPSSTTLPAASPSTGSPTASEPQWASGPSASA